MSQPSPLRQKHREAIGPAELYERDKVPRIFEPAARFFLSQVPLKLHDRVLDVACGTGIVARVVAEQAGFAGQITGVDIDPDMLAVARTKEPDSGLRIERREGDAQELPFDPESFDLVLCQQGLQYFPDQGAALRSMRRVLAPGGRAALLVAASINAQDQPYKWAEMEALREPASHKRAEKERHPGYFQGGAGLLHTLVSEAGFRSVDLKALLPLLGTPGTLEQLASREKYSDLAADTQAAVVDDIREAMRLYDRGAETRLPVGFYLAIGHK